VIGAVVEPRLRPLIYQCRVCQRTTAGHLCRILITDENADPPHLVNINICRRCAEQLAELVEARRYGA
jgi:hypothetical protein